MEKFTNVDGPERSSEVVRNYESFDSAHPLSSFVWKLDAEQQTVLDNAFFNGRNISMWDRLDQVTDENKARSIMLFLRQYITVAGERPVNRQRAREKAHEIIELFPTVFSVEE